MTQVQHHWGGTTVFRGPFLRILSAGSAAAPGSTAMAGASGPGISAASRPAPVVSSAQSGAAGAGAGTYDEDTEWDGNSAGAPRVCGHGEKRKSLENPLLTSSCWIQASNDWRPQPQEDGDAQHDRFTINTGSESSRSGVLAAILQGNRLNMPS